MAYSVLVEERGDAPVVVVAGDADLMAADDLDSAIDGARVGHDRLVIDLDGVTLMDSRTIGVLVTWAQRLSAEGASMPIVCSEENVLRLFRTMGLDREFEFFPTRDEAFG